MSIHSDNYIWGCAKNIYNRDRSCGGSSGGDGGLVAARCVPLALVNDIGGSIRIPATFNGIVGFKPTQGRFSNRYSSDARVIDFTMNSGHFKTASGPFAHSVNDCIEFFKIQCD